nr:hypothetical protein [Tessaracoccus coleopterorum]
MPDIQAGDDEGADELADAEKQAEGDLPDDGVIMRSLAKIEPRT